MNQPIPANEWRVVGELGGSTHEFTFTDFDTVWPARTLARAIGAITPSRVRVYHRRTTRTDWIAHEVAAPQDAS